MTVRYVFSAGHAHTKRSVIYLVGLPFPTRHGIVALLGCYLYETTFCFSPKVRRDLSVFRAIQRWAQPKMVKGRDGPPRSINRLVSDTIERERPCGGDASNIREPCWIRTLIGDYLLSRHTIERWEKEGRCTPKKETLLAAIHYCIRLFIFIHEERERQLISDASISNPFLQRRERETTLKRATAGQIDGHTRVVCVISYIRAPVFFLLSRAPTKETKEIYIFIYIYINIDVYVGMGI